MTIKFCCPWCGKELDIMQIQMDKDLRFVFDALPTFGRHSSLVMGYACLFGVTPFAVKAAKLRQIIEEMKRLFEAQAFSYKKKTYSISLPGIVEALDICVKKNFDEHLEKHTYLKKVMVTIVEREEKDQSRVAEKELRASEQKQIHDAEVGPITEEQRQRNLTRVGDIIKSISGAQSES